MANDNDKVLDLIINKIESGNYEVARRLNHIDKDIKMLSEFTANMSHDVKRNADNLEFHMKRADLNERRLDAIEEKLTLAYMNKLLITGILTMGSIAGALFGIIKLIEYIVNKS